ncbi:unnamed protein product [Rhizophagus irregularis]|nr:unnamed protein product [Rhizophagus irregularis]CAB5373561.1 unnamed protein product [Rhizophagus irregularis]
MFVFKCKERKLKKVQKVAWSKKDETHRQALIKCTKAYAKAEQEVLSIPAEIWPDQFKPEYDLLLAESPVKEALVTARILGEFSDLTVKLIEELNYDFYWAVNETLKILSKVQGDSYDGDDLKNYDLGECDNSMEVNDMSSPVPSQHE